MTVVAILIAACSLSSVANAEICTVFGISDGDTLKVRCGQGNQITIRLGGIDAPETKQPFGQRSKQALSDLCYRQQATITPKSKDRYGRTVGDVECQGKDAGAEQVKAGMAWAFPQYLPSSSSLFGLQETAKSAKLGLWKEQYPIPPWEFRRANRARALVGGR